MSLTSRDKTAWDFYCLSAGDEYFSFDLFGLFSGKKAPTELPKLVNVLEEKLSYTAATEVKKNENSRLVLGFSLKSPDFTSKTNVEAFSNWGLNHFDETSVWLSGPLQRWTVLFEEIFTRVINDFSKEEYKSGDHQLRLPDTKPTDKESKKSAEKGEDLEKNAVGRLLQIILNDQPDEAVAMRDTMTSIGTPLINHQQATTESKQLTPIKARQKTPKIADILGDEGAAYRKKLKIGGKKKVFQLISWKYLTQGQGAEVQQSAKLLRQYMNDKNLSSAFEILEDNFGRSRLRYAYGKINDDVIVKIFNHYHLMLKKKINALPPHVINNPSKPENKKLILDYLVDNDILGLLSLSKKYTKNVFLEEFPVFMAECERARMIFQKGNTITHFAYPLSKSDGIQVFVFIAQLFKKRYGESYLQYFKWVDTSPLITPKKAQAGDAKELAPEKKSLHEQREVRKVKSKPIQRDKLTVIKKLQVPELPPQVANETNDKLWVEYEAQKRGINRSGFTVIYRRPLPLGPAKATTTKVFSSLQIQPPKEISAGTVINTQKFLLRGAKPLSLQLAADLADFSEQQQGKKATVKIRVKFS